jgi:ubiquitin-like 1-activating enzyme E1 B
MPYLYTEGGVSYEEGEGLEDDEIADNQARLPKTLAALPGGGIRHGTVVYVQDQGQALTFEMHVSHQVRKHVAGEGG